MKRPDTTDTIAAISSSSGPSLRSIVRLSGPDSWALSVPTDVSFEKPLNPSGLPISWVSLDQHFASETRLQFWPQGRSYTGQDLVEWHLPGPNPLAERLLSELIERGARPAEPGEFSFRAFMSGRIDLTQAEAVAGLFQASTQAQLEVALGQLAGGLAKRVYQLRNRLLDLLAWLEATLDFIEESDVSPITRNLIGEELRGSAWELSQLERQWASRDTGVTSSRILLVGRPNAGKSRLFNALADNAKALVSPVAGTTRDYLESRIKLSEGLEVTIVDTAGLGESKDDFDQQAQTLGLREQQLAGLLIVCVPIESVNDDLSDLLRMFSEDSPRLMIQTKADLSTEMPCPNESFSGIKVSAATGAGLEDLKAAILEQFQQDSAEATAGVVDTTRARTRDALVTATKSLENAALTVANDGGDELVAMDLRSAVESLDIITGSDVTEETLDRVFSRFCIGK